MMNGLMFLFMFLYIYFRVAFMALSSQLLQSEEGRELTCSALELLLSYEKGEKLEELRNLTWGPKKLKALNKSFQYSYTNQTTSLCKQGYKIVSILPN